MSVLIRHNGSGVNTAATTTWTFTPGAGYDAGHQALLVIRVAGAATVSGMTDNLGNTYVLVMTWTLSTTIRVALLACYNTIAGTPTISVTLSAAITNKEWDVSEWAGLGNPADVTATATVSGTSTTLDSGTTATTTDTGELALAIYTLSGTGVGAATITPASGYTPLGSATAGTTTRLVTHYHVTGAKATQDAVATSSVAASQANGIAVFPNLPTSLGSGTLSGQGSLYQIVLASLGTGTLAGNGALSGALGHSGQIVHFVDYCPRSGTTYLYKAVAVTAQGASAESAPIAASVLNTQGPFLHVLGQEAATLHQFNWDIGEKVQRDTPAVSFVQVEGRTYPLAEFDELMAQGTFTLNLTCYFDQGSVAPRTSADKTALDAIVYGRGTVCYRDRRGRKLFAAISDYQVTDLQAAYGAALTLTRTDDSDAV